MLKFDKMPESWNRKTLSQKEVREMAGRSERRFNQARSENGRYQAPSQPTSSFNKAPKNVATNKIQPDTLWDIMRKSITDPGHISEVVDSTTGQVISTPEASRGGSMLKGAAQGTAVDFTSTGGTFLDLLRSYDTAGSSYTRRANQEEENAAHYREMLERGTLDDGTPITASMRQQLEMLASRADSRSTGYRDAAVKQHDPIARATQSVYDTADRLAAQSAQNIAEAKEGLGSVGQFAVDVGVAGTQLAGDALLAALTGGSALVPMAVRGFGSGTQQARQEGATLGQQVAYGAGSAALSVATEKISNIGLFRRAFGAGVADNLAGKLVSRFGENTAIQTMNRLAQTPVGRIAASMLGEGSEEFIEDVFQPVLQRAIYDPDARFDMSEALYDFAVGAVLGGVGGGVDITRRRATDAAGTAQTEPAPVSTTPAPETIQSVTETTQTEESQAISKNSGETVHVVETLRNNIPQLAGTSPVSAVSSNAIPFVSGRTMADKAKTMFEAIKGIVKRPGFGDVEINSRSVKDDLHHGIGTAKAAVIPAIPEVIRTGKQIDFQQNWKGRPYDGYIFAAPVTMDGKTVYVAAVVKKTSKNKFYLHEVVDSDGNIIKIDTGDGANQTSLATDGSAGAQSPVSVEGTRPLNSDPTIAPGAENVNSADAANSVGAAAAGFTGDTERGFARNVSTDQNMAPELRESFREDPEMYFRLGNQKTLAKAQEIFDAGFESARSTLEQAIGQAQTGRKLPPEMVPLSRMVANQLARNGDVYSARKILSDISIELTQAGQLGQAAAIMRSTDPATKTMTIDKLVQNLQKQLSNQGVDLQVDSELLGAYANAETDAARDAALNAIEQNIADQIPSTLLDKWTALRYVNMLGNLKTQVRNLTGNVGMNLINRANNTVAAWMESISSKASGGKIARTRSAVVGKDLKQAARADFENVRQEALGDAKFSVENPSANAFYQGVKEKQRVFKSGLFESYRKATNWLMNNEYFGDEAFIRSAYTRSLAGYLKANNVTAEQFSNESWRNGHREFVDQAREFAVKDAQEQTFRDHNTFSDWISRIGRRPDTPKAIQTLSAGMMPFRRTPANVLVRAEEYSPLGLLNTAYLSAQKAASETSLTEARGPGIKGMAGEFARSGQDVTANDIISSLSKSLTGTGIFVLGMALANMGLLRGGPDDDEKQAEFDELTGHQDYSIELPNGLSLTIDWLTPAAMPLLMGAQLEKIREDGDITLKDLEASLLSIADPMIQMSMLQGVNDTMDSIKFSDDNLGQIAVSTALDYLTQGLTNTLVGQVRRSISGDNTMTYVDKNSIIPDWLQREFGSASKKSITPAYNQVPYIDAWGREEESEDPIIRTINNLLNPAYTSQVDVDAVEEELQRVYDATGESVFPSRADKKITYAGTKKELTADEYTRFATLLGRTRYNALSDAMDSPYYQDLTDEEKAKVISDIYEYSNGVAKKSIMSSYEPDKWILNAEMADNSGIEAGTFIYYRNRLQSLKDGGMNTSEANSALRKELLDDDRLTAAEKTDLDNWIINDLTVIPKDVNVDYSSPETFTITQMSDGAQRRWSNIKNRFGIDAETYQATWKIYQNDDLNADQKRARMAEYVGGNASTLYREFGKRLD